MNRARTFPFLILLAMMSAPLHAQTIDDGIMISRHNLFVGNLYTNDSWDHYWEGHLNRVNGNLGTVTTQTNTWYADYGVTNRLNFIASVPYVWTNASQGVLHRMQGFQDITLAAKYSFIDRPFTKYGSLKAIVVASGGFPLTNYEPDFQPLSIGNQSKRVSGRLTLNFQANKGWYLNGSSAYTFRDNVTLDVPYYYTNGQLFLTSDVTMPDVFDYILSAGYRKRRVLAEGSFSQQRTQGGGDIRRQDMPFISNHVNYSRVGTRLMYQIPKNCGLLPPSSPSLISPTAGTSAKVPLTLLVLCIRSSSPGVPLNENLQLLPLLHILPVVRRCGDSPHCDRPDESRG